jgi:hypothetical protein
VKTSENRVFWKSWNSLPSKNQPYKIMRKFFLLPILISIGCASSENKNTGVQDSTMVDTTGTVAEFVEEVAQEEQLVDEDTVTLDQRFTAWKEMIDTNTVSLLEVSISTHQYEASSSVTWYFDSEINPIYFSITWSSEGNEGSTEYVVKNREVMCAWIEGNSTEEKWCKSTGGFRKTRDENLGGEKTEQLDGAYGGAQSSSLESELEKLSAFFKEAGEVEEDGDWITFRLENVVNYGAEFTEYTEAKVHKRVFDQLK